MRTYVFYFGLVVILANFGYAFAQLGAGKKEVVSIPLLLGSLCAAVFAIFVIRKRLRRSKGPGKNES